jgi:superfamily II DNA or RNA helicase
VEEIQVQRRRERARTARYAIRNLGDHPVFSTFSIGSPSGRTYEVTIRSRTERANSCTCPDFLTNLVGTCKHVEAVLLEVRPPDLPEPDGAGAHPARPQVYLHHGEELTVRLLRGPSDRHGAGREPERERDVALLVDRHFRPDGTFRGDLARDFEGFREAAQRTGQVDVAPEVLALVDERRERAVLDAERGQWQARLAAGEHLGVTALPLHPYQESGALHLAFGKRAMLADDLGLGKTVQAIAGAELLRREGRVRKVLVVCPASVLHHWQREIFRFAAQEALAATGPSSERRRAYERAAVYTLVSYETAVRDVELLQSLGADLIVLDEAQRIRDWRARTADAIKRLGGAARRPGPYAFVLTGTTLEDRLDDLYSVMQFLDQRLLGPLWRFNQRYYVLEGGTRVVGVKNLDDLRARLARVMLRRRRSDVEAHLPSRLVNVFEVEMRDAQRRVYDEARAAIARELARDRPPAPSELGRITRQLARMRMACDAADLVRPAPGGGVAAAARRDGEDVPPKLVELERIVRDVLEDPRAKVVVCTEWERMAQLARPVVSGLSPAVPLLTGSVPVHRRAALVEQFRTDPGARVLVATDVGGTIDLSAATVVVNLDVPWSAARVEQRVARLQRPGSRAAINVVHLVAAGTIEEAILVLQRERAGTSVDVDVDVERARMPVPTVSGQVDLGLLRALITPEPVPAVLAEVPAPEAQAVLAALSTAIATAPPAAPKAPPRLSGAAPAAPSRAPPRPSGSAALPADPVERLQVLRRAYAEALGNAFRDLMPLGAGYVLQVVRLDPRVPVQAGGLAARLGVCVVTVDEAGLSALRRVIAPLVAAPRDGVEPVAGDTNWAAQAEARRAHARARLDEARCLLAGGLGPAALRAAGEAMDLKM